MRAKSIKNKARVNVEMSPAELKALLKKTQAELVGIREWATKLEEEAKIWRSGGKVEQTNWAPALNQALAGGSAAANVAKRAMAPPPPPTPSSSSASRAATPGGALGAIDGSRPDTPSTFSLSLDKDEREEFLKRENELSDQLAEKVSANSFARLRQELELTLCRNLPLLLKKRSLQT